MCAVIVDTVFHDLLHCTLFFCFFLIELIEDEEASDSVAVVVIPTVLVISSVVVVSLIFCSILRKRRISPLSFIGSSVQNTNSRNVYTSVNGIK